MRCASCQTENRAGRRFCAECGAPLGPVCSACGAQNEPEERFCGECGAPLGDEAAATEPLHVVASSTSAVLSAPSSLTSSASRPSPRLATPRRCASCSPVTSHRARSLITRYGGHDREVHRRRGRRRLGRPSRARGRRRASGEGGARTDRRRWRRWARKLVLRSFEPAPVSSLARLL